MPSVIESITSFVSSIVNAIFSVFAGALGLVQNLLNTVLFAFSTFFSAIGASVKELASTFEGLTKFLLSNIVVIGALAVAFVGYTAYQSRQGRPVTVGNKKVN